MSGEIWRNVPSVPEILVSNEGRVMRVPHREAMPNGGFRCYGGEPSWGVWNKQDCRFIVLVKGKTHKISRLIAEAFLGAPPFDDAVVMHVDENSANNRLSNLKWGTQKENLNAEGFLAYCRSRTGENSPTTKHQKNMRDTTP